MLYWRNKIMRKPSKIVDAKIWLDASKLNLNDNDKVSFWPDLSGNANHGTQSNSTFQPVYKSDSFNGKPCVNFSNQFINFPFNLYQLGIRRNASIFMVVRKDPGKSESHDVFSDFFDPGGGQAWRGYTLRIANETLVPNALQTFIYPGNYRATTANNIISPDEVFLYNSHWLGTSHKIYRNGEDVATSPLNGDLGEGTTLTLGKKELFSGATIYILGDISELIVYNRTLEEDERLVVEDYLLKKYNIQ